MADAKGSNDGGHSSGEYTGAIEEADVAYGGNAIDMSIVISLGERVIKDRMASVTARTELQLQRYNGV